MAWHISFFFPWHPNGRMYLSESRLVHRLAFLSPVDWCRFGCMVGILFRWCTRTRFVSRFQFPNLALFLFLSPHWNSLFFWLVFSLQDIEWLNKQIEKGPFFQNLISKYLMGNPREVVVITTPGLICGIAWARMCTKSDAMLMIHYSWESRCRIFSERNEGGTREIGSPHSVSDGCWSRSHFREWCRAEATTRDAAELRFTLFCWLSLSAVQWEDQEICLSRLQMLAFSPLWLWRMWMWAFRPLRRVFLVSFFPKPSKKCGPVCSLQMVLCIFSWHLACHRNWLLQSACCCLSTLMFVVLVFFLTSSFFFLFMWCW